MEAHSGDYFYEKLQNCKKRNTQLRGALDLEEGLKMEAVQMWNRAESLNAELVDELLAVLDVAIARGEKLGYLYADDDYRRRVNVLVKARSAS